MSLLKQLGRLSLLRNQTALQTQGRLLCSKAVDSVEADNTKGGFARAFEKYTAPQVETAPADNQTFASLLRNSKLVDVSGEF